MRASFRRLEPTIVGRPPLGSEQRGAATGVGILNLCRELPERVDLPVRLSSLLAWGAAPLLHP